MEEFDKSAAIESAIKVKESSEDFYEEIEAPKFVDFTVPDHYNPDDHYWFCLRVGCDQKHEEELNLEEINKNFVLRVMAARSPNIKIRKMLTRKQQSSTLKCPLTVPAKPSKSRISRLAVVSSISRKLINAQDKTKTLLKHAATPKANLNQSNSLAAKAFTTPRNRKRISNNADKFRSVRNPKPNATVAVPKTKVIAKALVFSSPKKVGRVKTSLELKTPVGKLCAAMSKLEIATAKKRALETKTPVGKLCAAMSKLEIASSKKQASGYNKTLPMDKTARKQFRGREVKSRVFDALHSHTKIGRETKPMKNMKRKKLEQDLEQSSDPTKDNDSSDMEIDEKSRHGSLAGCSVSDTSKSGETDCHGVLLETSRENITIPTLSSSEEKAPEDGGQSSQDVAPVDNMSNSKEQEEKVKSTEVKVGLEDIDSDDKENDLPPSDAENESAINEIDEKENTSASDDNREPNDNSEEKILTNHDLKKVNQVTKKILKKSSTAATAGGAQEAKYRKPKPTHPKPFRLRTDERGILKEATLEKKLAMPLKEISASIKPYGMKSSRKIPTPSQANDENAQGPCENENLAHKNSKTRMDKTDTDQPLQINTTNKTIPLRTKTTAPTTSDKSLERTKSPKNLVKPQGIGSSRQTVRLGVIKERPASTIHRHNELAEPSKNSASKGTKASASRSESRGRMRTTIPKEPNFHSIHVPRSCTKTVA